MCVWGGGDFCDSDVAGVINPYTCTATFLLSHFGSAVRKKWGLGDPYYSRLNKYLLPVKNPLLKKVEKNLFEYHSRYMQGGRRVSR